MHRKHLALCLSVEILELLFRDYLYHDHYYDSAIAQEPTGMYLPITPSPCPMALELCRLFLQQYNEVGFNRALIGTMRYTNRPVLTGCRSYLSVY